MESPHAEIVRYKRPENLTTSKTFCRLVRHERMTISVQVVKEGGENNLHSHAHMDGLWFVLGGKAKFYTTDDELLGEFGTGEGVFIPRSFPYWFEASSDEPLEILQVESIDRSALGSGDKTGGRMNIAPVKDNYKAGTYVEHS